MAAYLWIALAWLAAWCPVATAAIVYSAGQSEFTVGPGHRIVVPIYLDFDGAETVLLTNENGLFSAGVTVSVTDSMPNQTPAHIVAPADISPNVADFADPFGPVVVLNGPLSAQVLVLADAFGSAGVVGQAVGGGGRRVLIGSIAFTAGLNVGEVSTVHLGDYNVNTSDTLTWENAIDLDAAISGSDIVIRVVPDLGHTVLRVDGANGSGTGDGTAWGPSAFKFLQDALAAAGPIAAGGETVQVWIAQGSYRPDQSRENPSGTLSVSATFGFSNRVEVYGGFEGIEQVLEQRDPVAHPVVLTGNLSGLHSSVVVTISDSDASPRLDGVTVTGGGDPYGSGLFTGVRIVSASPTLFGVSVIGNTAGPGVFPPRPEGGGIRIDGGAPVIDGCVFDSNSAGSCCGRYGFGGAIAVVSGSVVVSNSTFTNNVAGTFGNAYGGGGAIRANSASTIVSCVFTGNSAGGHGGAVYGAGVVSGCTFTSNRTNDGDGGAIENAGPISECTFSNNTAVFGGALKGCSTIRDCVFVNNTAKYFGGVGAGGAGHSSGPFLRCQFSANSADDRGGALLGGTAVNCVFLNNGVGGSVADGGGGGMFGGFAVNSVFAGNTAGGPWNNGGGAMKGGSATNCTFYANAGSGVMGGGVFANCIFWQNTMGGVADENGQARAGSGTFSFEHCFVQGWTGVYGGTGNIGGGMNDDPRILGEGENVRLSWDSPCIDAGNNALLPADQYDLDADLDTSESLSLDCGGAPRRFDDIAALDVGAGELPIVDMGAFEYACLADYDANTFVNGVDFDAFVNDFYLGNQAADIDHNSFVNGVDFDVFVAAFEAGC